MRRKVVIIVFLVMSLLLISSCAPIQVGMLLEGGGIYKASDSKLSFKQKGHLIFIKAQINNSSKEYTFLLDTGAPCAINKKVADELGLTGGIEIGDNDAAGNTSQVRFVALDYLTLGDITLKDIGAGVIDFEKINKSVGLNIDGLIGSNALKFLKIIINYQAQTIILSNNCVPTANTEPGYKVRFGKEIMHGLAPKVKCVINSSLETEGIIDTGMIGYLDVPVALLRQHNYPLSDQNQFAKAKGEIRWGAFGPKKEDYIFKMANFKMGDLEIPDIGSFTSDCDRLLIGSDFLANFVVTLNYPAEEMVLAPIAKPNFGGNIKTLGLAIKKDAEGKTLVSGLWTHSPADRSDIKIDDEIIQMNGHKVQNLSVLDWFMMDFYDQTILTVKLLVKENNGIKEITLKKESLLP